MSENDPAPETTSVALESNDGGSSELASDVQIDEFGLDVIAGLAESDPVIATPSTNNVENASRAPLDSAPLLDAIQGMGDQLGRRLDALQTTFDRELRAEATRERVIDRLHAELQEYKQDFLLKVQRPIFIDLIQLHDDIGKMADARPAADAESRRNPTTPGIIESVQTAIEDILYRQGVEPFAVEGDEFDPRKQRAVSTQVTDNPGLNKKVASRLRKGFQAGDKLIRPEVVTVFTFRPVPPIAEG